MLQFKITPRQPAATHPVPPGLLGQNLEVALGVAQSLLADRLRNPKFLGPAQPQSGIAPQWNSYPDCMHWNWRAELTQGLFLSGRESQMLALFEGDISRGLVQTGIWIKKGETLEVDLWALAQSNPVKIEIGLRPAAKKGTPYARTEITIETCYWRNYKAILRPDGDDENAEFFIKYLALGLVWYDQIHLRPEGQYFREDLIDEIRALRPTVIRFPGGCESTVYHWKLGLGPPHLRPEVPDPVFKRNLSYDFGTDEYLQLCLDLGATPHISVAVGGGTPEEAGQWAAHCADWFRQRNLTPPLMYWHIGNEHFGAWEIGNMSSTDYARTVRDYAPFLRDNYPNCRVIAQGPAKAYSVHPDRLEWRKTLIEQASEHFDVIALQMYGIAAGWPKDQDGFLETLYRTVEEKAGFVLDAIRDGERIGKSVAVTEWNLWAHATHHGTEFMEPADGAHLMFVSGLQNAFFRSGPGLELVNYYHLVNVMGLLQTEGSRVKRTAIGELFHLYRDVVPGEAVAIETEAPEMFQGISLADAVCFKSGAITWLFVTNRSMDQPALLDLTGWGTVVEQRTIAAPGLEEIAVLRAAGKPGKKIELPPLSVTRLKLDG